MNPAKPVPKINRIRKRIKEKTVSRKGGAPPKADLRLRHLNKLEKTESCLMQVRYYKRLKMLI